MRDDEYDAGQIAAYGENGQPAVAVRMRPHLRMTQVGNVCALLGIVSAVIAVVEYPSFNGSQAGAGWAVTALVTSIVMLLICTGQHVGWLLAMAVWSGRRRQNLDGVMRVSWLLHALSYVVVLLGLWACIAGSRIAGWSATSAALLALTLALMVAAQVLAGVQYLRPLGPPGTIPVHTRNLIRKVNASR